MNPTTPVSVPDAAAGLPELWSPRIVGDVNGTLLKVARLRGEFDWHRHESEDEAFLVLEGDLVLRLRDRDVRLGPGDLFVVPRGVEHKPVAAEEVRILLVEPSGTVNTGDGEPGPRTVPERWL